MIYDESYNASMYQKICNLLKLRFSDPNITLLNLYHILEIMLRDLQIESPEI